MRALLCIALGLSTFGCGSGSGPAASDPQPPTTTSPAEDAGDVADSGDPFTLNSFWRGRLQVTLTLDGEPLAYASVSVLDPFRPLAEGEEPEDVSSGGVYHRGLSSKNGIVDTELRVPTRFDTVDLVVHHPRTRGPYTFEELREMWGLTAPSSRIALPREDFPEDADLPLELTLNLWRR